MNYGTLVSYEQLSICEATSVQVNGFVQACKGQNPQSNDGKHSKQNGKKNKNI